jgi:hypothetical protein
MTERNVPVPIDADQVEEWREDREDGSALRHFHGPHFHIHQKDLRGTRIHAAIRGLQESDGSIKRYIDIFQVDDDDDDTIEMPYLTAEDARDLADMLSHLADHIERFHPKGLK